MKPNLRTAARYCLYATLLGAVLSMLALIVVVSQSGYDSPSLLSTFLVCLAYWPMLLAGWSTHDLLASFWNIPINVLGWSLLGLLLGLIRGMTG